MGNPTSPPESPLVFGVLPEHSESEKAPLEDHLELEEVPLWEDEDSTAISTEPPHSQTCPKSVRFGALHIRSYSCTIGDHPYCTMGCPLTLTWEHVGENSVSVDDYEASRARRRTRQELRMNSDTRREILSETHSAIDIRRVERKLSRQRSGRAKIHEAFFQVELQPPEGAQT